MLSPVLKITFRAERRFEMAYVTVPKDLTKIKSKVMFNLTKRQLICFSAAVAIGLPLFFLVKDSVGTTTAALCRRSPAGPWTPGTAPPGALRRWPRPPGVRCVRRRTSPPYRSGACLRPCRCAGQRPPAPALPGRPPDTRCPVPGRGQYPPQPG